jgi:hypothetical protein
MKTKLLILFSCIITLQINSQIKAVTETGETVILNDNGTWIYENNEEIEELEIPINSKTFSKGDASTFLLKSTKFDMGFWLDPKKWSYKKADNNPEAEYELQLKGEDLYGMIISEEIEVPIETLKGIAIENGKAVAPDLKIVKEEYRMVNGLKVLHLQMNGTMQGIKFSYYGYYYSNESGTVQFITYTSQNLLNKYQIKCEELLNGMVKLK